MARPGAPPTLAPGVVINEVLTHTDEPATDAIELLNTSSDVLSIGGWYLSDSSQDLFKFEIPPGTTLAPGDYIVFDETHFNPDPLNPEPQHFALSGARGDDVWLVQPATEQQHQLFVDEVHFPAAPNGESFGRFPNGTGPLVPLRSVTLGQANSSPRVGPVLISEVQYAPGDPSLAAQGLHPAITANELEFVEITNTGTSPVDLTDWRLRGGIQFDFPAGVLEPEGQRVVVSFDPSDPGHLNVYVAFLAHYGLPPTTPLLGPFEGRLDNAGERVTLQRPDDPPVDDPLFIPRLTEDEIIYDDMAPWPMEADGGGDSLQRVGIHGYGGFATSWEAARPTPGAWDVVVPGDLNQDRRVDARDIDLLFAAIDEQNHPPQFDLNDDRLVDQRDADKLVREILQTDYGDVDLDGDVDAADATLMVTHWSGALPARQGSRRWSDGDSDGDGDVDTADRNRLAVNWTGAVDIAMGDRPEA